MDARLRIHQHGQLQRPDSIDLEILDSKGRDTFTLYFLFPAPDRLKGPTVMAAPAGSAGEHVKTPISPSLRA